jgi:ABC-type multidrug transport system ATPase subunit
MSHLVECKGLTKRFSNNMALNGLDFTLEKGPPIALVGPNGAGKTTLFSILCGYIAPTSGSVELLGCSPSSKGLFGKISALPQDAQLDPRFAISHQLKFYAELQGIPSKQARKEAERVLDLMGLVDVLEEKPGALSHGMRKRVSIAQALMGSPELVLLDEPTAGLDPVNARNVRRMVSELSGDTTFIISSHNLHELEKLCDTVLYLEKGVLKQQSSVTSKDPEGYITIHLDIAASSEVVIATFEQLAGVNQVRMSQQNEYILQYDRNQHANLDQQLLQILSDNGWEYKQLLKGKSLEEQLFSEH